MAEQLAKRFKESDHESDDSVPGSPATTHCSSQSAYQIFETASAFFPVKTSAALNEAQPPHLPINHWVAVIGRYLYLFAGTTCNRRTLLPDQCITGNVLNNVLHIDTFGKALIGVTMDGTLFYTADVIGDIRWTILHKKVCHCAAVCFLNSRQIVVAGGFVSSQTITANSFVIELTASPRITEIASGVLPAHYGATLARVENQPHLYGGVTIDGRAQTAVYYFDGVRWNEKEVITFLNPDVQVIGDHGAHIISGPEYAILPSEVPSSAVGSQVYFHERNTRINGFSDQPRTSYQEWKWEPKLFPNKWVFDSDHESNRKYVFRSCSFYQAGKICTLSTDDNHQPLLVMAKFPFYKTEYEFVPLKLSEDLELAEPVKIITGKLLARPISLQS